MNIRTILGKLATRPATQILKVMDWLLSEAETHWEEETQKHMAASHRNEGTSMGVKANAAYNASFNNWHTIRQIRSRISAPVRLIGGEQLRAVA